MSAELAPAVGFAAPPLGLDVSDPANAEYAALLNRDLPITQILAARADVVDFIDGIEAQLTPARYRKNMLEAIIDARMRDDNATAVVHGNVRAELKTPAPIVERRVDVLRELLDLKTDDGEPIIPQAELDKAIWNETPPPVVKTHLTYLRKLAKYGSKVQDVLARGVVESVGLPRLVFSKIETEPKNVTPAIGERGAA